MLDQVVHFVDSWGSRDSNPDLWDDVGEVGRGRMFAVDDQITDRVSRATLVTITRVVHAGSSQSVVTVVVVPTVWSSGPRVLTWVYEPCDDSVGRRFFRLVSGFLAGRILTVVSMVVSRGVSCSYLYVSSGGHDDFGLLFE